MASNPRRITRIVVHCAATRPHQDIGAAEIRRWHTEQNGWNDIGYHWVIRRDGEVEAGRPESRAGAHAAGHNHDSIGICLVGGLNESGKPAPSFEPVQLDVLKALLERMRLLYPQAEVQGHRDLPGVRKACPSFDVAHWRRTGELLP
jgi:N-acetyl-anhydromuramyl-L-alanine amidase AmpD